ncbi:MAG: hypothetical protein JSW01_04120 [Candidatus Bathyarchaeota archaeon]|nr:MAG: hypothetical protein JSW01_04120 [Candidatus Bathyarchaeota archaeon]
MKTAPYLILGHMPFVGVSYQTRERDEEYRRRFSKVEAVRVVVDAAIRKGVKIFAAATPGSSSLAPLHLQVLRQVIDEEGDIELIPCVGIPIRIGDQDVDPFRRWATYLKIEAEIYHEVTERILGDPILNFRPDWRRRLLESRPYRDGDFQRLRIDWGQMEVDLEQFVDLGGSYIEPGSETDFIALANRLDLLGELIDRLREKGFPKILFGVHHAGVTIPRLDLELDDFEGYLTPLNPLGVMMFPTKISAETAVRSTEKPIYAIKPLAGGRAKPKSAFRYVFDFDLEGCMIGVGSVAELEEDFQIAVRVLQDIG